MNHITQRRVSIKTELTQEQFEKLHEDASTPTASGQPWSNASQKQNKENRK